MTNIFTLAAVRMSRLLVLLICSLFISSCGFHLRTNTLASYISSVDVTGTKSPRIVRSLESKLNELGIVVDTSDAPDVRVQISEHSFEKEASLLAPLGGMIEYELTLTVVMRFGVPNIEPNTDVVSMSATRKVKVNTENLLSTSAEEQLVRRELSDTIVDEIIRTISHEVRRPLSPPSNEDIKD
ncbi:MAG: hypothetical protein F4X44_00415 [Gammaproteobacteria bacterium]|nr:hypothetical protein [Gammaproteobacteria bacterium]MYD79065.1 hypothetical protein [Gammaproteobacteria bacterium]